MLDGVQISNELIKVMKKNGTRVPDWLIHQNNQTDQDIMVWLLEEIKGCVIK